MKLPLVYSNVLVRDWRPWQRLGVHEIYGVSSFHSRVKLDYPVSMGDYRCPRDPAEPMVLHMVHVPQRARHRRPADGGARGARSVAWTPV